MPKRNAVLPGVGVVLLVIVALGAAAGAQTDTTGVGTRALTVRYQEPDQVLEPIIVDRLEPSTVLTIRAEGFETDRTGVVSQCVTGETRVCRNHLETRFDENGAARFQYLVTADGGCRLADDRCTVEIRVGDRSAVIDTVFVDRAPPAGRITVTPRRDLLVGDTVSVSVSGFPAGASLTLTACAAPSTSGPRCGAPGPVAMVETDSAGEAMTELTLDVNEVGPDRVACGRRVRCRIVVSSDATAARALPVTLHFSDGSGASYDPARVAIGLAVALALGAGAARLVRLTDWDPPPESDGSAIDNADYADLDREVEEFETRRLLMSDP